MFKKINNIFYIIISIFPVSLWASPILAIEQIGVVKSKENEKQWSAIINRLEQSKVNYCIVDSSIWSKKTDLKEVKVLFLPNVANLNQEQAQALDQWMKQGGKLIVTGDSGNGSTPEVRSKLRWLFGGYLQSQKKPPQPSTAKPMTEVPRVSGIVKEGVLTPVGKNTQTAAVWGKDRSTAIVITNNSTFLGWRWGYDQIAPATLDQTWLKAALKRYGIEQENYTTQGTASSCLPSSLASQKINPDEDEVKHEGEIARNFPQMNQQLDSLIERFESTLITADSMSSGMDISLEKAIEQTTSNQNKQDQRNRYSNSTSNHSAYQALIAAKEKQQNFINFFNQGKYQQAKREWTEAQNTLWNNYPTDRKVAEAEIRAIWLDRKTIVQAKSEADLAILFDRLKKAGINTIFFETINAGYTIYPSQVAPQQNPLTQGWDPLASAVKLAHERGMELHAWVWVFAAANQRHNLVINKPLNYLGPVLSLNRDWAITDQNGNIFDYSSQYKKAFLDPANPEVRKYILSVLEEIVTRYKVDGIQLDYIRYPFQDPKAEQNFGYSKISRQIFQEQTGVDPINLERKDPLWQEWVKFKTEQVNTFVREASQLIKNRRPEIILSTAVFPLPTQERLNRIQQNWETWATNHWVDMIVLMTYSLNNNNISTMIEPLFDDRLGSTLLLPGIRLLDMSDSVAIDRTQLMRHLPTGGYSLFAVENFSPNLQQIFSRTQGNQKEPIPHRQPFQAAAIRYQSLQREWSFLVANQEIQMEPTEMIAWAKQADFVTVILNQLAKQPSSKNLLTAQIALSSLQKQLPQWMRQQQEARPYQVQAWINRLATVDKLLSYGERISNDFRSHSSELGSTKP